MAVHYLLILLTAPFALPGPGRGSKSAPRLVCRRGWKQCLRSNNGCVAKWDLQNPMRINSPFLDNWGTPCRTLRREVLDLQLWQHHAWEWHGARCQVLSKKYSASGFWNVCEDKEDNLQLLCLIWLDTIQLDFVQFDATKTSCLMVDLKNLEVDLRTGYLMVDLKFGTALRHGDQASTQGPSHEVQICWATVLTRSTSMDTFGTRCLLLTSMGPKESSWCENHQWPWPRGLCLGHFPNQSGGRQIQLQQPCQDLILDGKMHRLLADSLFHRMVPRLPGWTGPQPTTAMVRAQLERQMDYLQLKLFFSALQEE